MRRRLAALVLAVALAEPSAASEIGMIERVADLVTNVCLAHGGDADAVAKMADEMHWPALADETVERLDWPTQRPAHLAAWQAGGDGEPIALTMGWGEYHYRVGQTVWAFAPRDEREAVLLPLSGASTVTCQLNFAVADPAELFERVINSGDPSEDIIPFVNHGVATYEGGARTILWFQQDAIVLLTFIPDPVSPRGVISVTKPFVSAPTRLWPPLRLNASQRLLRQGQRGP